MLSIVHGGGLLESGAGSDLRMSKIFFRDKPLLVSSQATAGLGGEEEKDKKNSNLKNYTRVPLNLSTALFPNEKEMFILTGKRRGAIRFWNGAPTWEYSTNPMKSNCWFVYFLIHSFRQKLVCTGLLFRQFSPIWCKMKDTTGGKRFDTRISLY